MVHRAVIADGPLLHRAHPHLLVDPVGVELLTVEGEAHRTVAAAHHPAHAHLEGDRPTTIDVSLTQVADSRARRDPTRGSVAARGNAQAGERHRPVTA